MSKYQEKMNNLGYYIVKDQYNLPTQENIEQLEKQLGFELPSNYKDFLSFYGLSAFEEYVYFPFQESYPKDDKGLFSVFFGIYSDDSYDLIDNYYSYQGRMSSNLLPIANDPGGNIICMSINTDDKENIYFWDHEDEIVVEKGAKIDNSNLYLIANSFDEFINSLEIANL
ncbi:MAG: SMI1/KNR4 family protein [Waterburya sp.]